MCTPAGRHALLPQDRPGRAGASARSGRRRRDPSLVVAGRRAAAGAAADRAHHGRPAARPHHRRPPGVLLQGCSRRAARGPRDRRLPAARPAPAWRCSPCCVVGYMGVLDTLYVIRVFDLADAADQDAAFPLLPDGRSSSTRSRSSRSCSATGSAARRRPACCELGLAAVAGAHLRPQRPDVLLPQRLARRAAGPRWTGRRTSPVFVGGPPPRRWRSSSAPCTWLLAAAVAGRAVDAGGADHVLRGTRPWRGAHADALAREHPAGDVRSPGGCSDPCRCRCRWPAGPAVAPRRAGQSPRSPRICAAAPRLAPCASSTG